MLFFYVALPLGSRYTRSNVLIIRNSGNCECIATWRLHDVAPVVLGCVFFAKLYCACAQTAISELPITITLPLESAFQRSRLLKKSEKLEIRRRFHAVTLTFDPLTSNVCSTSLVRCSNSTPNSSEIRQSATELLVILQTVAFTFCKIRGRVSEMSRGCKLSLSSNFWYNFGAGPLCELGDSGPACQISTQSRNVWLSY